MSAGERIVDFLIKENGHIAFSMVFMPYNKSMWNCMESVYDSALEKGLDAYVMPIPFFTFDANGDYIQHYDADEYDFDVYSYEELDKVKPKYIVLHNQYDDGNIVTSVHPDFYSNKLVNEGYHLIYIPYGIPFQKQETWMYRSNLTTLADYTFVSSEDERQAVIDSYAEIGVDMSKRIICLGSPKLDAVLKERDYVLPYEWEDKIFQKRVCLLCNSLSAFVNNPLGSIETYRDIIAQNKENGRVTWYRPHPLLANAILTMRPEYLGAYFNFIDDISKECIIDETSEIERAIDYADEMISDPSSVIEMWKVTKKPYKIIGD